MLHPSGHHQQHLLSHSQAIPSKKEKEKIRPKPSWKLVLPFFNFLTNSFIKWIYKENYFSNLFISGSKISLSLSHQVLLPLSKIKYIDMKSYQHEENTFALKKFKMTIVILRINFKTNVPKSYDYYIQSYFSPNKATTSLSRCKFI